MRLNRNLFFTLLMIFCVSIIIVIDVDGTSVLSRIGTGLMTGSFIGMIGAFVNYMHQRSEYFANLATLCWDISKLLRRFRTEAKAYNWMVENKTKEEIVNYSVEHIEQEEKEQDEMKIECESIATKCKGDLYVPFFFWNTYYSSLTKLCDNIQDDFQHLYAERETSRVFDIINNKLSEEEKQIVIGNEDEFYKELCQACKDYYDIILFECYTFSNLLQSLCNSSFKKTINKSTIFIFQAAMEFVVFNMNLDNIRNVREERWEKKKKVEMDKE